MSVQFNATRTHFETEVKRQIAEYSEKKVKYDWNWLKKENTYLNMTEVKIVNPYFATIIIYDAEMETLSVREIAKTHIDDLEKMFFELQN